MRISLLFAFGNALPAQPEKVCKQKKEDYKCVFLRDPIERNCIWTERPKGGSNECHFSAEQLGSNNIDQNCGERAEDCTRQPQSVVRLDVQLRLRRRAENAVVPFFD